MKATVRERPEDVGKGSLLNRTGVMASPTDASAQAVAALEIEVELPDGESFLEVRAEYEADARPVGTVPPPSKLPEMEGNRLGEGISVPALIDRVGERLAFERSGVRLYQGLIGKLATRGGFDGGPNQEQLEHFMEEELEHFQMLSTAIAMLGGDPTAMTPSADVGSVATSGLVQVISDPRSTLPEALHAILIAELADNDGWDLLIQMTRAAGNQALSDAFAKAKSQEDDHLDQVRDWLSAYGGLIIRGEDVEKHRAPIH